MQSQQQQQPNYQQQQPMDPNAPQGHAQAFLGQAQQDGGYYGTPAPGPMGMVQQQPPPQQMPNQQQSGGGVPYGQYPPGSENYDNTRGKDEKDSNGCLKCMGCCIGTWACCEICC